MRYMWVWRLEEVHTVSANEPTELRWVRVLVLVD